MSIKKSDTISLIKYITSTGIASRRKAQELIQNGEITINHAVETNLMYQVQDNDTVRYNKQVIKPEEKVYIALNKPAGYITTLDDPENRKTVMQLLKGAPKKRLHPVGRLDANTTGIIVITNDGDLTQKLAHPKNEIKKVYHALLDQPLKDKDLEKVKNGITLRDGRIKADRAYFVAGRTKKHVGIEIHSGRYRIVRRIFKHLGYNVIKLDRVGYANLTKRGIKTGEWRYLKAEEIEKLKN